jgi:hypothetical protein
VIYDTSPSKLTEQLVSWGVLSPEQGQEAAASDA